MPSHWLLEGFISLSGVTASSEPLQVGTCGTTMLDCGVAIKVPITLIFFYFRRKVEAFTNHNILKRFDFLQSFMFI